MSDEILYDRDPRYIPRVAAVHDMCGYGKCSLTAAIPILSAAGCDVCPVPTALFSAHTRYEVFTFHDTTEILDGYLTHGVRRTSIWMASIPVFLVPRTRSQSSNAYTRSIRMPCGWWIR